MTALMSLFVCSSRALGLQPPENSNTVGILQSSMVLIINEEANYFVRVEGMPTTFQRKPASECPVRKYDIFTFKAKKMRRKVIVFFKKYSHMACNNMVKKIDVYIIHCSYKNYTNLYQQKPFVSNNKYLVLNEI